MDAEIFNMLSEFQMDPKTSSSTDGTKYFFIKAQADISNKNGTMAPGEWWPENKSTFKGLAKLAQTWLAGSSVLRSLDLHPWLSTDEQGKFNTEMALNTLMYAANRKRCSNCYAKSG